VVESLAYHRIILDLAGRLQALLINMRADAPPPLDFQTPEEGSFPQENRVFFVLSLICGGVYLPGGLVKSRVRRLRKPRQDPAQT